MKGDLHDDHFVNLNRLKNTLTRSDFEKHLTIQNCDKTVKIILRSKNCKKMAKKRRRFDVG